ncbi:MAG TPA: glycosyltransferase [Candidatus Magasanikbacteria bacterium]|nr:glycosyltransferase [Candidatus Magasanikbacteria bacterium]
MATLSLNTIYHHEKELKYLPFLIESLKRQTFQDFEVKILNNGLSTEMFSKVENAYRTLGVNVEVVQSPTNIGFAGGQNLLFKKTSAAYVLMLNSDMYLMPNVLQNCVDFLERHREVFGVSVRLMRWDFAIVEAAMAVGSISERAGLGFTNFVDAIGIRLLRNRRAVEWLTREEWVGDSANPHVAKLFQQTMVEVFGVSGAMPVFRTSALQNVLLPGGDILDPTYHSYKEDLDIAYRLRNAGYTSYVLLDTVTYHDRTAAGPRGLSDWSAAQNKQYQTDYVRYHSYKNHLRTLYKNEYWQNFLIDFPFIFWYELKKFGYFLFTNPGMIIRAWYEILKNGKYTYAARQAIKASRKTHWRGLRRWFYV